MSFVKHSPITAFFVLAYALGWLFSVPNILAQTTLLPFSLPPFLGAMLFQLAPASAALIVTGATSGRTGIRALLRGVLIWRVSPRWYGAALGVPFAVQLLAIAAFVPFGGSVPQPGPNALRLLILVPVFFCTTMGEEIGWRGFALPRLQTRFKALVSAAIVGVLWGFWHLPPTLPGFLQGTESLHMFLLSIVLVVGISVLMTWIFNNSAGSLLLAALFHTSYNAKGHLLLVVQEHGTFGPQRLAAVLFVVTAVLVAILAGPENLSRQRTRVEAFS